MAAMSVTCQMDIQTVPGLKNIVFGGEGLFNTVITGPGHVWLQTMPISSVAERFEWSAQEDENCSGKMSHESDRRL